MNPLGQMGFSAAQLLRRGISPPMGWQRVIDHRNAACRELEPSIREAQGRKNRNF